MLLASRFSKKSNSRSAVCVVDINLLSIFFFFFAPSLSAPPPVADATRALISQKVFRFVYFRDFNLSLSSRAEKKLILFLTGQKKNVNPSSRARRKTFSVFFFIVTFTRYFSIHSRYTRRRRLRCSRQETMEDGCRKIPTTTGEDYYFHPRVPAAVLEIITSLKCIMYDRFVYASRYTVRWSKR